MPHRPFVGRGSSNRKTGRFERFELVHLEECAADLPRQIPTEYFDDESQSVISKNNSPDLQFNFSLNPYRGCAHGCSYCYARPSHEFLGWGPGIDFESKIVAKRNAGDLFRSWLARRNPAEIEPVMISGVTDPYQPIEKQLGITRDCLKAALEFQHPVQVITKNRLICRDIDLLSSLAADNLISVAISITTIRQSLTRIMEPRTSSPASRLQTISELAEANIPVIASLSPVIPGINDDEIPQLLEAVKNHGATSAFYIMLRLPFGVQDVFLDWLDEHFPDRKPKVVSRIASMREGKLNSSEFGIRMKGKGIWAEQIQQLFDLFANRFGLNKKPGNLECGLFRKIDQQGKHQKNLF